MSYIIAAIILSFACGFCLGIYIRSRLTNTVHAGAEGAKSDAEARAAALAATAERAVRANEQAEAVISKMESLLVDLRNGSNNNSDSVESQ